MKIRFLHQFANGRADDWAAVGEGLPRKGIGRTTDDALASLVRANLATFGIVEIVTEDQFNPIEANRLLTWQAEGLTP